MSTNTSHILELQEGLIEDPNIQRKISVIYDLFNSSSDKFKSDPNNKRAFECVPKLIELIFNDQPMDTQVTNYRLVEEGCKRGENSASICLEHTHGDYLDAVYTITVKRSGGLIRKPKAEIVLNFEGSDVEYGNLKEEIDKFKNKHELGSRLTLERITD